MVYLLYARVVYHYSEVSFFWRSGTFSFVLFSDRTIPRVYSQFQPTFCVLSANTKLELICEANRLGLFSAPIHCFGFFKFDELFTTQNYILGIVPISRCVWFLFWSKLTRI